MGAVGYKKCKRRQGAFKQRGGVAFNLYGCSGKGSFGRMLRDMMSRYRYDTEHIPRKGLHLLCTTFTGKGGFLVGCNKPYVHSWDMYNTGVMCYCALL